ncbi:calcium-binding protein [Actinoplanes oblitus]|uniref:Calcium-binding protein n=1 Tax=Actinoplanes oblitus TaxID=3040509 RepID=A0ABY8WFG2_9ACTN|nr:calcium-binding protein [Actinoplanes oblitus]WIM96383.1 calcium-binding protein [Actinoplanes oblitus]
MPRLAWTAAAGITLTTMAAVGTVASPAQAATGGVASVTSTTRVQYKAASGKQNRVVITRSGRTITIDDQVAVTAGKGCKKVKGDRTKVRCTTPKAPTGVTIYTYDRYDVIVNDSDLRMKAYSGTGNDTVFGGSRRDEIQTGSGNDKADGRGGNDTLWGLTGNDTLRGGTGDDQLWGLEGNDRLYGDAGGDILEGGLGRDYLNAGDGNDSLRGDETQKPGTVAADLLLGGAGWDLVSYSERTRAVSIDADGVKGDDGQSGEHDSIGADVESFFGGSGNDRITGNAGDGSFSGGDGNDVIHGGAGNDYIAGGEGADKLYGDAGDDSLDGSDYDKQLADLLDGGANNAYGDHCEKATKDTRVRCEN